MGLLATLLTGCAAGSPGVIHDPTVAAANIPAAPALAAATETLAPTLQPTETSKPAPTETPESEPAKKPANKPTRTPEPQPTARPEAPAPDESGMSSVVERAETGRDEVALTFDAGSDRGNAEAILNTLADYGVKASFGITGMWADENPDLVKRMVDEGHMVYNHSWDHRSFTGFSTAGWDDGVIDSGERAIELSDTNDAIVEATGGYDTRPYFRPPYGDFDDSVLADAAAEGYSVTVMWTCDSFGWNGATVDEIVETCGVQATAGDIVLMHVGGESLDSDALPALIETLQSNGFALVTVEELLQP